MNINHNSEFIVCSILGTLFSSGSFVVHDTAHLDEAGDHVFQRVIERSELETRGVGDLVVAEVNSHPHRVVALKTRAICQEHPLEIKLWWGIACVLTGGWPSAPIAGSVTLGRPEYSGKSSVMRCPQSCESATPDRKA